MDIFSDYFWNYETRAFYKLDSNGYLYKYNNILLNWKNVSGYTDLSFFEFQDQEAEEVYSNALENLILRLADKYKTGYPNFLGGNLDMYSTNNGLVVVDDYQRTFEVSKNIIKNLKPLNKVPRDYIKVSYEDAFNILVDRPLGDYSLLTMDTYIDDENTIHAYAKDGSHFSFRQPNTALFYEDNEKPKSNYKPFNFVETWGEFLDDELFASLITVPCCFLPELKALKEYQTMVVSKYNDKHPDDKIPSCIEYYEDPFGKVYGHDANDNFYEFKKTSVKKIGDRSSLFTDDLCILHNQNVVNAVNHYASRRTDVKKGHITIYDIYWYGVTEDGDLEGISDTEDVYLLRENGQLEMQNRTRDITTIHIENLISRYYVARKQAEGQVVALLDDCKKEWREILLKDNIKLGNKLTFYGEEMEEEDQYKVFMKDENGRNYRVTPHNIYVEKNNKITDDFVEIPSYNVARSFFRLDDPMANTFRSLMALSRK